MLLKLTLIIPNGTQIHSWLMEPNKHYCVLPVKTDSLLYINKIPEPNLSNNALLLMDAIITLLVKCSMDATLVRTLKLMDGLLTL